MRKAGLALALVASTQLTLLSSPAFAADASASGSASATVSTSGSATTSDTATAHAAPPPAPAGTVVVTDDDSKKDKDRVRTGWILVGVGSAVGVAGIVVNIIGANSGHVPGEGGPGDTQNTDNTRTDLFFLGTTLIVAGVVTGVYGGAMVWSGNLGKPLTPVEPTDKPEIETNTARLDSPVRAAQARLASAPSFVVPIVGATF